MSPPDSPAAHLSDMATDTDTLRSLDQTIRDFAGQVRSGAQSRVEHPTYGYTKTRIREHALRMEGAICAYAVVTGQRTWAGQVSLEPVTFLDGDTTTLVECARAAIFDL